MRAALGRGPLPEAPGTALRRPCPRGSLRAAGSGCERAGRAPGGELTPASETGRRLRGAAPRAGPAGGSCALKLLGVAGRKAGDCTQPAQWRPAAFPPAPVLAAA